VQHEGVTKTPRIKLRAKEDLEAHIWSLREERLTLPQAPREVCMAPFLRLSFFSPFSLTLCSAEEGKRISLGERETGRSLAGTSVDVISGGRQVIPSRDVEDSSFLATIKRGLI